MKNNVWIWIAILLPIRKMLGTHNISTSLTLERIHFHNEFLKPKLLTKENTVNNKPSLRLFYNLHRTKTPGSPWQPCVNFAFCHCIKSHCLISTICETKSFPPPNGSISLEIYCSDQIVIIQLFWRYGFHYSGFMYVNDGNIFACGNHSVFEMGKSFHQYGFLKWTNKY